MDIIFAICHPPNASSDSVDADLRAQVESLMARNKSIFVDATAAAPVASPQVALELKAACGLSHAAFRLLRPWMQNHGVSVLPSEHRMRARTKTLLAGIEYETGVPSQNFKVFFWVFQERTCFQTSSILLMLNLLSEKAKNFE